jgi:hypothetical protein
MEAEGTIAVHEYEIREGRRKVAEVSKKWFHQADSYGVAIVPGADDILILAITVVSDMMLDEGRKGCWVCERKSNRLFTKSLEHIGTHRQHEHLFLLAHEEEMF